MVEESSNVSLIAPRREIPDGAVMACVESYLRVRLLSSKIRCEIEERKGGL